MNRKNLSTKLAAMAALGLTFVSGSALAQTAVTASDQVEVIAQVLGDLNVVAMNSPIDLGTLLAGDTGNIASSGVGSTNPASAARFDVFTSATGADETWVLTVAYANLARVGSPADIITIAAPTAGLPICFHDTVGSQAGCTEYANPANVLDAAHDTDGSAWVGFSYAVPALAPPGNYTNVAAIVLTADVTLN